MTHRVESVQSMRSSPPGRTTVVRRAARPSRWAAAAHLLGLAARTTRVVLPGGDLDVEWNDTTLWVTGPAAEVAAGELDAAWLTTR